MSDVNCPYCSAEQEINHDDGQGYEENTFHEQQCVCCDKNFTFTTSIHFYYEAHKADCLNDASHNYKKTYTSPIEFTKMKCTTCEDERNPTKEEMKGIIDNAKTK